MSEQSHDPDAMRCTITANEVQVNGRIDVSHFQETIVCKPNIQLTLMIFAIAASATTYSHRHIRLLMTLPLKSFLRIGV